MLPYPIGIQSISRYLLITYSVCGIILGGMGNKDFLRISSSINEGVALIGL